MENQTDPATYDQGTTEEIRVEQETPANGKLSEPFSWQATEGVHVPRGTTWYVLFAVAVLGLMALAVLVFKSITFAILLPVMAVAVILLRTKAPRIINYAISPKGIYVADRLYDFSEFRAFGIIQDPDYLSIIVLPVKRFSPGLTLYFNEDEGERIVDMLGARLPMQDVRIDSLEKLIRAIRL